MIAYRAGAASALVACGLLLCLQLGAAPVRPADSAQVEQLMKRALGHSETAPDSALAGARQLLEIGQRARYPRAFIYAYRLQALVANIRSDNKQALAFYQRAMALSTAIGDTSNLSRDLYNVAGVYAEMSDYEKVFVTCTKALRMKQALRDTLGVARCYKQLAEYYEQTGNPAKAAVLMDQSIGLYRQLPDSRHRLSKALISKSLIEINARRYASALQALQEANQIADSAGDKGQLASVHLNLGFCFDEMGDTAKAMKHYLQGLRFVQDGGRNIDEAIILDNIGQLCLRNKDYRLAEPYLLRSLSLAASINSFVDLRNAHSNLSELYFRTGDLKKAYAHKEQYAQYADSLLNEEKMKTLADLSIRYETEETAARNALLQKENDLARLTAERDRSRRYTLIYSFAGITLLLVGGLLFLFYYLRQQRLASAAGSERLKQRLLLAQMNPHFIFNSIDNIQGLIFQKNNDAAINYLNRFSRLTRQILENSTEDYIPLSEEVTMLDNYLNLQLLLHAQRFTFAISIAPELDADGLLIPPMLVQPFVENAIRHGLKNKQDSAGSVEIRFYLQARQLFVEVRDNGEGLLPQQSKQAHKSLSTRITQERLDRLLGRNRQSIQVVNIDPAGEAQSGVKTFFEIPYVYDA